MDSCGHVLYNYNKLARMIGYEIEKEANKGPIGRSYRVVLNLLRVAISRTDK
jgi:hypothetical protein